MSTAPCQSHLAEQLVVADSEQIEHEIRAELSRCQCPRGFPAEKVDDTKYKVHLYFVVCLMIAP